MRRGLWVVAAAAVFSCGVVMAQDQNGRPQDRGARQGSVEGQNRPGDDQNPGPGSGPRGGSRPGAGPPNRPPPRPRPPSSRPPPQGVPRPPGLGPRPPHRFLSEGRWHQGIHGPAFHYPPGFGYRRWSTGLILPPIFLTPPYYFDAYAPLGLGPPPAGYRWVRYGPDLLLVNIFTGRIADVVDGVFY
jgi:Ni/Co efflux regulator RcnB